MTRFMRVFHHLSGGDKTKIYSQWRVKCMLTPTSFGTVWRTNNLKTFLLLLYSYPSCIIHPPAQTPTEFVVNFHLAWHCGAITPFTVASSSDAPPKLLQPYIAHMELALTSCPSGQLHNGLAIPSLSGMGYLHYTNSEVPLHQKELFLFYLT
jgi:hypothetical protein